LPSNPVEPDRGAQRDGTGAKGGAVPPESNGPPEIDPSIDLDTFIGGRESSSLRLAHLMYLVAGVALLVWLGRMFFDVAAMAAIFIIGGLVFLFASALGLGSFLARRRSIRQDTLLAVLAIAAERGMPLVPAVAALADQYRGRSRWRTLSLAANLNHGAPLPAALERAGSLASRDVVLLAWVGNESGSLPKALRLAGTTRSAQLPIWTAIAARLSYIIAVIIAVQVISGFILYFVLPRLEAIYRDFSISLPRVTVFTIEASHFAVKYGYFTALLPLLEVGLLIFLPFSFLGWGNYHIPIFDRLLARRHTALVLRALSLWVLGGKPLARGLAVVAEHYPTEWVRRRLLGAHSEIEQGADWVEALWRWRIVSASDADVLHSAAAVGNLPWALVELAETIERRLVNRAQAIVETLFPLAVIALGAVVSVLAVAYFIPIVRLIAELSNL
jgi:type II secretory pathway component PulF